MKTVTVISGKGGTGKTTMTGSFGVLADNKVMADCDVDAADLHLLLHPEVKHEEIFQGGKIAEINQTKCIQCGKCIDFCEYNALALVKDKVIVFKELCHACGGCSIVCPTDAISEQDRQIGIVELGQTDDMKVIDGVLQVGDTIAPPIIDAIKEASDENLLTVLDSPPGTGCPMVESVNGCDFALLVTEPTPFGLNDVVLAAEVVKKLDIPAGIVINRSDKKEDIIIEEYCQKQGLPILMRIPMEQSIAEAYSEGKLLIDVKPQWKDKFNKLFDDIKAMLNNK